MSRITASVLYLCSRVLARLATHGNTVLTTKRLMSPGTVVALAAISSLAARPCVVQAHRWARGFGGERSFRGNQSGQHIVFSDTYVITVLYRVYMWRILQFCGIICLGALYPRSALLTTQPARALGRLRRQRLGLVQQLQPAVRDPEAEATHGMRRLPGA